MRANHPEVLHETLLKKRPVFDVRVVMWLSDSANQKKLHRYQKTLSGTYEEMLSNWRNKKQEAAERNNLFSSFMNTFQFMHRELAETLAIEQQNLMECFDPHNAFHNAQVFVDAPFVSYYQQD